MTTDPSAFHVVYVDRRARTDRTQRRDDPKPTDDSNWLGEAKDQDQETESEEVVHNVETLLSAFNSGMHVASCVDAGDR